MDASADGDDGLELGPLTGIRVVDMTVAVQGPHAAAYLADMGADVVHVEPPGGELNRYARSPGFLHSMDIMGTQHAAMNRGKRSLAIDAHGELGRDVLHRLVAASDVFVTNYRREALERMGLGYGELSALNPRLVYARVSGFGPAGPDADKAMLDGAAQARGGLSAISGPPDGPPNPPGAAVADHTGAMQLALGVMTALFARSRTGRGQEVNTSSLGALMWIQAWEIANATMSDVPARRAGQHHPMIPCPYGVYETADGGAFLLAVAVADESWDAFWTFAGMPEMVLDDRWDTAAKRIGARGTFDGVDEIRAATREAFGRHTTAEWDAFFSDQPEIIYEKVATYQDLLADPMVAANGYLAEIEVPNFGPGRVVTNVVQLGDTPGVGVQGPPPTLGQHTAEIMTGLGFDADQIASVVEASTEAARAVIGLVVTEDEADRGIADSVEPAPGAQPRAGSGAASNANPS
jgi:crotonobetainyl-CoA:carnitine CoA-transferase CaiB-like acyl-CoA transferase